MADDSLQTSRFSLCVLLFVRLNWRFSIAQALGRSVLFTVSQPQATEHIQQTCGQALKPDKNMSINSVLSETPVTYSSFADGLIENFQQQTSLACSQPMCRGDWPQMRAVPMTTNSCDRTLSIKRSNSGSSSSRDCSIFTYGPLSIISAKDAIWNPLKY